MKRILLCRIGAWGDCIIVTPLVRYLKEEGNEVYLLTSAENGTFVFANNPHVDKLIPYARNTVPIDKLNDFYEATRQAYECDEITDLSESIECTLVLHPNDPQYNFPKEERKKICNKNYYEYTLEVAGFPGAATSNQPELFFTHPEETWAESFFKPYGKMFTLLWVLSGSGRNKSYPAAEFIQFDLLKKYPDLMIITSGDNACKILETAAHPRLIHQSGQWDKRQSMIACKYVNMAVSPDTGMLHASGCFSTPKVGLLEHSTIENITKHFENDHSIETDCDCAPCFRLVYNAVVQCPIDPFSGGCWCMTRGLKAERVFDHISTVIDKYYYGDRKRSKDREIIKPEVFRDSRVRIAVS